MKHVASIEVLHNEQAMQSWTMPDKIEWFFSKRGARRWLRCVSGTDRMLLLMHCL
jgi:hypothetical protein